jgi:FAD/FMN-containing dehydrogenase
VQCVTSLELRLIQFRTDNQVNRRAFLEAATSAGALTTWPRKLGRHLGARRKRPSDAAWPSPAAWQRLRDAVGGNLIPIDFPLAACQTAPGSVECKTLFENLRNPYYIGDHPGLTQTLGWIDAWTTKPSVYAVAARNAADIAAAVDFAREHQLRLVIKGGGHSYQGTSNAPDSLLIWTRRMQEVTLHTAFVPQGCEDTHTPHPAVTLGAGAIWMQAYDAVTTQSGRYVQGGGCTTVGVAGLIQSGGFGSFSKHYGLAAAGLLEAEVVTADGKIRIANACRNPDLFWALKGGGGGSFGVVSKLTLRLRELPEFFGGVSFTVKATSDAAYKRLIRRFVGFYQDNLFNPHWGEQVRVNPDHTLEISMVFQGLDSEQAKKIWQPFLDAAESERGAFQIERPPIIVSVPARKWWDVRYWNERGLPVFVHDPRPGSRPTDVWWTGDAEQVGWVIYALESLWLPASLLEADSQEDLSHALFAGSRHAAVGLHFNKGLAGSPIEAVEESQHTAMNPAVSTAFALAIVADGQKPAYPGILGHEPDLATGRRAAGRIERCMRELHAVAPNSGAYVSESNFFQSDWQHSYWGNHYAQLATVKRRYDPAGLFFVHNGVGSEGWSADGFTRL